MDRVEKAFQEMNRADFVPKDLSDKVTIDAPLPIGYGQTISQPSTVRHMLSWLDAKVGDTVLDVGSGSGWATALLASIVGSKGKVYAVERIPELVRFGQENCRRAGVKNALFFQAEDTYGLLEHAPYERILVSASAQVLPKELLSQLKVNGTLVIPVQNDILEINKISNSEYESTVHSGFVFVPLI